MKYKLFSTLSKNYKQDKSKFLFILLSIMFIVAFIVQFIIQYLSTNPADIHNSGVVHQNYNDTYMDFFNINFFLLTKNPYKPEYSSSYPPLNFVLAYPFASLEQYSKNLAVNVYLFTILLLFVVLVLRTANKFSLKPYQTIFLTVIILISTPFIFLIERANYAFLTFFFTAMFLFDYNSQNKVKKELSYIYLAIASATKLYPAIFAVLLLKRKNYKGVIKSVIYTSILFVLPFFLFEGGFIYNVRAFLNNLLGFSKYTPLTINVSLTNFVKIFAYLFGADYNGNMVENIATVVKLVLLLVTIISLFISNSSKHVIGLCALMSIILPNPVKTQSLIFMFIPIICFICSKEKTKLDIVYAILFVLILTPLQFGYIIDFVPKELQYIGIQDKVINYLGLTVNTFISAGCCVALTILFNVEVFIKHKKLKV